MENNNNIIKKQKISHTQQDIIQSRLLRKLNRILEYVFEIGYYDSSPNWYWLALKKTLLQTDEIINYVPILYPNDDYSYAHISHLFDNDVEMNDIEIFVNNEKLNEKPIIECCWYLLDRFFEKIENKNLYFVRLGFLHTFDKIVKEFIEEYGEK
ncbi:MAG: hypothetical protein Barrevirus7_7 [Barrevirus sp.]|uniref:Uncharacterized protein n=1 Tax=Barrevirus sp. TaxID=2487763 RepID=A0A3G4ZQ22_9VIRU|nr:MAG: hypothetical protein Barrevirus7_7 [Barrevirus sp.]